MKNVNYGRLPTEQRNSKSGNLDRLSVNALISLINQEDHTVPRAVARAKPEIAKGIALIVRALSNGGRLFFAGAGTSGRLGVLEAAECPPTFNTPPGLVQAVMAGGRRAVFRSQEGAEDREAEAFKIFNTKLRRGDITVGIAASGVTPFVQGALKAARRKKCKTILVTCMKNPPSSGNLDCVIALEVGPEIITGSTRLKAGTATKLVLNMLTAVSMIRLGKVYRNWMVDLQPRSRKLHQRALRIIQQLGEVPAAEAEDYLRLARKNVKLAVLMARKRLDYHTARRRLKKNNGFLGKAIAE